MLEFLMLGVQCSSSSVADSQKLLTDVQIDYAANMSSKQVDVFVQNVGSVPVRNIETSSVYFGVEYQEVPIGLGGPAPNWNASSQHSIRADGADQHYTLGSLDREPVLHYNVPLRQMAFRLRPRFRRIS